MFVAISLQLCQLYICIKYCFHSSLVQHIIRLCIFNLSEGKNMKVLQPCGELC